MVYWEEIVRGEAQDEITIKQKGEIYVLNSELKLWTQLKKTLVPLR